MTDMDDSVTADFLVEAGEIAERLGEELVALEQAPDDPALLNAVFRGFHTIKGGAGFLELPPLVDACHAVEEAFGAIRAGKRRADAIVFDGAQSLLDRVCAMLAALADGTEMQPAPAALIERVLEWAGAGKPRPTASGTPPKAVEAFVQGDEPITDDEFEALLDQLQGDVPEVVAPAPPTAPPPREPSNTRAPEPPPTADPTLRIEARRLDAIVNLVGELVLARNRLKTLRARLRDDQLDRAVGVLDVATTRLQNAVMKTRMQPVGRVFQRFPKLARDVARSLNKEVELVLEGAETELDRTLVESLSDPLVHLVRNAIDHGIEAPDERERRGKPRAGRLLLAARQEGDQIAIEVREDGAGMDPDAIRRKAIEKGAIEPEAAARLSPEECHQLIFLPGFSTKEAVTEVSGRGVGMDVVQSRIRELNGRVQIVSKQGEGTAFIVRVPLTLAILPALLVSGRERTFALPLARVEEVLNFDSDRLRWVDGHPVLNQSGRTLPLISLSHWLGGDPASEQEQHLVVMHSGETRIGLRVDRVLGREEIVVKPLPKPMHSLPGHVGAALTGDGSLALILDVEGMASSE